LAAGVLVFVPQKEITAKSARAYQRGASFKALLEGMAPVVNIINFFTAVITPLAAYFSIIFTELHR